MMDAFREWRGYTPLMLVVCAGLISIVAFLVKDKLNTLETKSDKTFQLVSSMNDGLSVYKIEAENRFTKLEMEVSEIQSRDK